VIRVTAPWTASYDPALAVRAGERLAVGRRSDDEWPGWVWCENASGLGGWLPAEAVAADRAVEAFDTREMTVAEGDEVEPGERRAGWTWCRLAGREGWVPDRCLDLDDAGAPPVGGDRAGAC
jgi:hypothetical protein